MIKIENVVTPSPEQWKTLILGARNAMFTREPIAIGRTVEECLEKVVKDYKENMK